MTRFLMVLVAVTQVCIASRAWCETDAKAAAHEHFDRGVLAFNDRRFQEAAREFETAYRLSPAFEVLYNIGQVNSALGRAVNAADAFERYLAQGGSAIDEARRAEVQAEIQRQSARIGELVLRIRPEGASVRVDGALVDPAQFAEPVRLTEGVHTVVTLREGYLADVRDVQVPPRSQVVFDLDLKPASVPAEGPIATTSAPAPVAAPVVAAPMPKQSPEHARPAGSNAGAQRTIGLLLGGAGLAAVAVGATVAVVGAGKVSDARGRMQYAETGPDWDAAKQDYDAAKTDNTTGWWVVGVGAGGLVTGIVVVITAPSEGVLSGWTLAPWSSGQACGATARAIW